MSAEVEGRLESLADHCYERFNNRFFLKEKVIVMNPEGEQYDLRLESYVLIVC